MSSALHTLDTPTPGTMRLIERGPRDKMGRCHFDLEWMQGTMFRAQCFHAEPEKHVKDLERRGWRVEIVREES